MTLPSIEYSVDKDEIETFKYPNYIKRLIPFCYKKLARKYLTLSYAYLTIGNTTLLEEYMNNWFTVYLDNKLDE